MSESTLIEVQGKNLAPKKDKFPKVFDNPSNGFLGNVGEALVQNGKNQYAIIEKVSNEEHLVQMNKDNNKLIKEVAQFGIGSALLLGLAYLYFENSD